jgi:uncharacterized protein (TIGR03118 family)
MKISRVALIVPLFTLMACGSDNDDHKIDASLDLRLDHAGDTVTTTDTATDTVTDAPVDVATDTATDTTTDTATDTGTDTSVDGPKPPRFTRTLLVIDQVPVVDAGADGGGDASADASADGPTLVDGGSIDAAGDAPQGPFVDPNLINPWGLAFNPTGPIWVADNGTGVATVYASSGLPAALVVTIPTADGGTPPAAPTGLVFNPTTSFMGDKFIFDSEDGTIVGWQTGTAGVLRVDNSAAHAIYKGLTMALRNNVPRLYATDFHNRKIDVFDANYAKVTTTGGFADANIPAGFAPFGIQADGSVIMVTYAKQDTMMEDDVAGVGNGYIDVFDFDGVLTKRLISQGMLNSPWGLAIAPADFGGFPRALIVGNFGDGHINAYDASTGAFLSTVNDALGVPFTFPGLWALVFGNDTPGAVHNQLFFTAGGKMEDHGTLGRIDFVP